MNFYTGNLFFYNKKYAFNRLVSISSIDSIFDYDGIIPRHFNLVAEGNGPNSLYMLGLYDVLKKLQKTCDITISKYVGSGITAIVMICLCSNMEKHEIINFCKFMFHNITNDCWKRELLRILPSDAYSKCSGRVYIYTSVPICSMFFIYKPLVFFEYRSNRDIVEACAISCQKPSLIGCFGKEQQLKIWIQKLDGVDRILLRKKQLYELYALRMNELMRKANKDAEEFFKHHKSKTGLLEWHDPSQVKKHNLFYYFLSSIMILFFFLRK